MTIMTLQDYWEQETIPSVIGFALKDGKTLNFKNLQLQCRDTYEFIEGELSTDEYIDAMELQIYFEFLVPATQGKVVGGAIAMGNEGFILYVNEDGEIQWSMFQMFSNPFFNTTTVQGNIIHAITELNHHYTIPIFEPQNISCISKNEWGY